MSHFHWKTNQNRSITAEFLTEKETIFIQKLHCIRYKSYIKGVHVGFAKHYLWFLSLNHLIRLFTFG